MNSGIFVRRAVAGEAGALSDVAFAAKGHWGYPAQWMESWRGDLTISPGFVRNNEVYVAVADGELAGFYALVGEGRRLELEHLWVLPGRIGTGLGRLLFGHAMRRAFELGAEVVGIESDPNAKNFYLSMGARRVGENVYEVEGRKRVLPVLVVDLPEVR